ncbi:uncharacterized protein MYCFIDRAFT_155403 [Pseudocercospora fijiensis CIRAD86]|uniref:PXA domain-containing protein n=1 Tax=Pseudocercospora fijiensis (strain CIRAD86) TaxID=383855 RepID=M3AVM0_PSEFD|nr:uncharacterized protein MYCFIDRAFT_155403 [Pseudocercospora fijiensis CIRAD86]EME81183.1 hypothetical protein MYCFIDRAFT_155403 [Pseudocercospora fijiensis CIRAD86]
MDRPDSAEAAANEAPMPVQDDAAIEEPSSPTSAPSSPHESTIASTLQSFTDRALHFLSHATNETLGACLVGLGATTYLVLGRVGLVIIGVAGGVVLHATWEGVRADHRDEATKKIDEERKREASIEVARRLLELRSSRPHSRTAEDTRIFASHALDYSSFGPETAAALDAFTTAVIRDYVHYWYDTTIPGEQSFPATCRRTFTAFVLSLSGHLQRKRPADAFLDFVMNASSMIIVFLQELAAALNASPNATAEEAISTYLLMKPESHLAHLLDRDSQALKMGDSAEDVLQSYLDPKHTNCPPVYVFLKEVFAKLVLGYTVDHCSQPAWINDWIVYGLEKSETAKEVMDIVDAGMEGRKQVDAPKVEQQIAQKQPPNDSGSVAAKEHRRRMSRAEEAMDEAMQEARRLTELMIAEDERRAAEERAKGTETPPIAGDSSDATTQGAPTPTSSQSDRDRQTDDTSSISETAVASEEQLASPSKQFTSFDQMLPRTQATALSMDSPSKEQPAAVLTLHNANISIFDDSVPGEKASLKAKPTTDYMVQIEPVSSAFPGWMIVRKYADFETLHEVLRRLSTITGVPFANVHPELPKWRVHTKASLRTELERYLTDAVRYQPLAESEGMKRFLEKEQGMSKSPNGPGKGFGWPTPDAFGKIGDNMFNALTKAPKQVGGGVAAGGKAVFGGVAGLVGGTKKASQSQSNLARSITSSSVDSNGSRHRSSMQSAGQSFMTDSYLGSMEGPRQSQDLPRSPAAETLERRGSSFSSRSVESLRSARLPPSSSPSRPTSVISHPELGLTSESVTELPEADEEPEESISLPPPPSEMPADYDAPPSPVRRSTEVLRARATDFPAPPAEEPPKLPKRPVKTESKPPLTERETSTAIELMFAVITQLYTLSGAWQIRRTLLGAAKAYLLRPGNPQLLTIRDLLQKSMLDSNLSDAGVAYHVYELRKNTLPTAEEMEIWKRDYPEKTDEQKEELRIKARKLLVTKGMPQALTSVMGAAASGEALGKVFDCLQIPSVSRGLIFGLMLQALRVVTH